MKFEEDKSFWKDYFKTIPQIASIPSLAKNDEKKLSNKADRYDANLDKNLATKINKYCKKNKISVFDFLLSIYSVYLKKASNTEDFAIGTPILNRTNFKEKNTTGMFVNTVPIRFNDFRNYPFIEFAKKNSANMMRILRHQKYSYAEVLEDLRNLNKNTPNLYNIMLSYQITKAFDKTIGNYLTSWSFNGYITNDIDIHILDINDTGNIGISYDYLIRKYNLEDIKSLHERITYIIDQVLKMKK